MPNPPTMPPRQPPIFTRLRRRIGWSTLLIVLGLWLGGFLIGLTTKTVIVDCQVGQTKEGR